VLKLIFKPINKEGLLVQTHLWSQSCVKFAGLEVTFSGNPGHGLAFIQNNAAEKMVSILQ